MAGVALLAAACAMAPGFAGNQVGTPPAMEEVLTMRVDGTIAVDETGKVIGYELATKLEPKLRELIDKAVPGWLFFPPTVDGKPSAAKTSMRITLLGRSRHGGYEVSIDNVLFSKADDSYWSRTERDEKSAEPAKPPIDDFTMSVVKDTPKPAFPKFNINGMVTILLNIGLDGRVIDAVSTQCSLYHASGSYVQLARACKAMGDNSVVAIRKWRFLVDVHGKPPTKITATLPLQFIMPGQGEEIVKAASQPGQWRLESRTPHRLPDWAREERFAQRMGTSDAVGGEMMSSDSPLRLRDGQVGKAL